jgi:hypothetical protein
MDNWTTNNWVVKTKATISKIKEKEKVQGGEGG